MTINYSGRLYLHNMLRDLKLYNFPSHLGLDFSDLDAEYFVMQTCQRTLVVSFNDLADHETFRLPQITALHAKEAYIFMLEVICGLQSKLLGENEIVGQFKSAYKEFVTRSTRCTRLQRILEKLFKDAKEIRTNYLIGLGQKTYAAVARKVIMHYHPKKVLILGSGQLAEDMINQLKKKSCVYLCARNTEKAKELCKEHNLLSYDWQKHDDFSSFACVVNTIGTDHILWDADIFRIWKQKNPQGAFIDLGSPSSINTDFSAKDGVMRLEDVFKEGAIREEKKKKQIAKAKSALLEIAENRRKLFCLKQEQNHQATKAYISTTKLSYA